jgi:hypothetical protein
VGRIRVGGAGEVQLDFPPLPGHGSLRPRSVTLVEGTTTQLRLDALDLERLPADGR